MNAERRTGWLLGHNEESQIHSGTLATRAHAIVYFAKVLLQAGSLSVGAFLICVDLRDLRPRNGLQDSGSFDLVEWI